jgi:sarcosine oxidase
MRPDVIVAGLGAVGAAAAWQLAARGLRVLGLDRHRPPHDQGSSHGETRITRTAIGEGEHFVPLVRRTDALLEGLEARFGTTLGLRCGGLFIGADGGTTEMHGRPGFIAATVEAARRLGVPHEVLQPDEVRARFPAFSPAETDLCYYEPGAGMLFPEKCLEAKLAAAIEAGAELRFDEPLLGWEATATGVRVTTPRGVIEAGELVIAAGGWAPGLARGQLGGAVLLRQLLHWLPPSDPSLYQAGRCPVFIWAHGGTSEDCFYGFPLVPGAESHGVKIAGENFSIPSADPGSVDRGSSAAETDALLVGHLSGRMRGLGTTALKRAVCLYTATPDAGFVLDRMPDAANVTLVSACSGHGFKHAAAVGEQVAILVSGGGRLPPPGFHGLPFR